MPEYPKAIESKIIEKRPLLTFSCFFDPTTPGKFVPSNCKIAWSLTLKENNLLVPEQLFVGKFIFGDSVSYSWTILSMVYCINLLTIDQACDRY